MQRWRWGAQSAFLLRLLQGNAIRHTRTGTSLLHRTGEERLFCTVVVSHANDDTLRPNEELKDIKHGFSHPLRSDEDEVQDVLYECKNEEIFATLESTSGTHDALVEAQSHTICNILNKRSNIEEHLQPFVKCLSTDLVVRVLKQVTNMAMVKKFFNWAAEQAGYKHDIFVYNEFLMKFSRTKDVDAVWRLLKKMQQDCPPTSTTFAILIQNYIEAGAAQECFKAFEEAEGLGVKLDAHIYTTLMQFLFDVGQVGRAKRVLAKMRERKLELDIDIWSMVIHGLCKNQKVGSTEGFLNQMQTSGCMPNADIYDAMIVGFCESNDSKKALSIYDAMQKQGCKPRSCTYNTIVKVYCNLDMFAEADSLISNMQDAGCEPSQVTFNILLEKLLEKGKSTEAANLFKTMFKVGVVDSNSYRIYVSSLRRLGGESKLIAFAERLFSKHGTCDVEVCNAILQYYCELGELNKASKYLDEVFVRLSTPNDLSYALMIDAFCKSGDLNAARSLLSSMDMRGCKATDKSYEPLVMALCKDSKALEAWQVIEDMNEKGIQANSATCHHLLQALSDAGFDDAAIKLCHYITDRRRVTDRFAVYAFVKCLSKANRLEEAKGLVRAMMNKGCVRRKSVSFKYALYCMLDGKFAEVEKYLHKQLPNVISYSAMLKSACKKGKLGKAKSILSQMKAQDCAPNSVCYNALITGLIKSKGGFMESLDLYEEMLERGVAPLGNLHDTLMETFCKAREENAIMKLGELIIAKGSTLSKNSVSFLAQQPDESKLKKLYFELNANNCLVDSVPADIEEEFELDGEDSE